MTNPAGKVEEVICSGIGCLTFSHPKANCLPLAILSELAERVQSLAVDNSVQVIVLRSEGQGAFSAGASFDEFERIDSLATSERFFMGFAQLILAMRSCPKLIVCQVQGKAVGGAVGIVAASDYVCASAAASVRLSEFELGLGPFTIGPAVERRIGAAEFSNLSIDCQWRDAEWAKRNGLFAQTYAGYQELVDAVDQTAQRLAVANPEATRNLKAMLWQGTEYWSELLPARAKISAELLFSQRTQ